MSQKIHYLLLFLLFLIGMGSVAVFRLWQVKKARPVSFPPSLSSFTLEPPADAVKGKFLLVKGKVKKEPREKDEFEDVDAEEEILTGEKLATGEESQVTVEFTDFMKVNLGSGAEVGFVSLLPANFLISQSSGSVTYMLLQDKTPISVRGLHTLFTFNSGESEVAVEEEEIIAKVISGKAKLALVDLENKTHVWQLKEGQRVLVNDVERRVEIEGVFISF